MSDVTTDRRHHILVRPGELAEFVPTLPPGRLAEAEATAHVHPFRVPRFYAQRVLNGDPDDPLLTVVLPAPAELLAEPDRWDCTPSEFRVSDSPFWIQKYEREGLLRLTERCSGHCRYCYRKTTSRRRPDMSEDDVHAIFDDVEQKGAGILELILSGGDPLCASTRVLAALARRVQRLRTVRGPRAPYVTVHTREPVWNPVGVAKRTSAAAGSLAILNPSAYVLHVVHPREVTSEFQAACRRLAGLNEGEGQPVFMCQHPIIAGVNDDIEILEELYSKLFRCSPPVIPHYLVHPFPSGTAPGSRLSLERTLQIYRAICRLPGCLSPRLVVPTPWGKCYVGPNDCLRRLDGRYVLTTKGGREVHVG